MRTLVLFCLSLLLYTSVKSQVEVHNQFIGFYSEAEGPYIETSFVVIGSSLSHYENENGKYQALIVVTEIFKQDEEIVDFKKYELAGPELADSIPLDFMNQERFALKEGYYNYELSIMDAYALDSTASTTVTDVVHVTGPDDDIMLSSLQLIQPNPQLTVETTKFSKSGYEIYPLIYDYYPAGANTLAFYTEIYNTDVVLGEATPYLVSYHLENYSTAEILTDYRKFDKLTSASVNVLLKSYDISTLPTGTYTLVVEVRDQENNLLSTKQHRFYRMQPVSLTVQDKLNNVDIIGTFAERITDEDSLNECLYSMHPVAWELERNIIENQIEQYDLETKQQFLYSFWVDRQADDPEGAFKIYMEQVHEVDLMFGTKIREGYETDRGRVYLMYGTPHSITDRPNESSAYPYQIWHYEKAREYANKRFVFYNPDLVSNDYVLLHSDIPGEIRNDRWELVLNSRNNPTDNLFDTQPQDTYGGNASDYWATPR